MPTQNCSSVFWTLTHFSQVHCEPLHELLAVSSASSLSGRLEENQLLFQHTPYLLGLPSHSAPDYRAMYDLLF